jgi:hypothetical protein
MAPPQEGSSNSWSWTTNGTFDSDFKYTPSAALLQEPANSQWSELVRGKTLTNTYGPIGDAPMNNDWN